MNKLLLSIAVCCIALSVFSACNKVADAINKTKSLTDSTGIMTATVGGVAFKSIYVKATKTGSMLSIYGSTTFSGGPTIDLTINQYATAVMTTSFNIGDSTGINGSAGYLNTGTSENAAHGTISITSVSPILSGTFSFTDIDSTKITGGTFSVTAP